MPSIKGWEREFWHSNLDDDKVQKDVKERGCAEIAVWRHRKTNTKLAHIYEPGPEDNPNEKPFVVKLVHEGISREEEGRFATRREGDAANKALQRNNPKLPEVSLSTPLRQDQGQR